MDKEAREKITKILVNMLLVEGTGVKVPLNHYTQDILANLEQLGYRKLPKEPPLLSDEDLWHIYLYAEVRPREIHLEQAIKSEEDALRAIAQTQREVCVEHYEG